MLRKMLSERINEFQVSDIAQQMSDEARLEELLRLLACDDKRTSDNAAWVMSHLPKSCGKFLVEHRAELMSEAMRTTSATKRRLILTLLSRQTFAKEELRADFIDYCLELLLSTEEPVGVKSAAMKVAYAQCRHYAELLAELRSTLEMMVSEELNPGLRNCRNKILSKC